jgi:hypothetical protein
MAASITTPRNGCASIPRPGIKHHVANIESFWGLFKRPIKSTHIHVSAKHMQRYLDEFTFREPPRDGERDVRSDSRRGVAIRFTLHRNSRKWLAQRRPLPLDR